MFSAWGIRTFLAARQAGTLRVHYTWRDATPRALSWALSGRLCWSHAGTGWTNVTPYNLSYDGESDDTLLLFASTSLGAGSAVNCLMHTNLTMANWSYHVSSHMYDAQLACQSTGLPEFLYWCSLIILRHCLQKHPGSGCKRRCTSWRTPPGPGWSTSMPPSTLT